MFAYAGSVNPEDRQGRDAVSSLPRASALGPGLRTMTAPIRSNAHHSKDHRKSQSEAKQRKLRSFGAGRSTASADIQIEQNRLVVRGLGLEIVADAPDAWR